MARVLGGHASFGRSLELAVVVVSYTLLVFALAILILAIVGIGRFGEIAASLVGGSLLAILAIGLALVSLRSLQACMT